MKDQKEGNVPRKAGRLQKLVSVGLGLALGALAGIIVGLVTGVGIATILGIL